MAMNEVTPLQKEFFVPDLCATRPVFLLVLLSQLLVIVRVLLVSELPLFNWELLGLSSMLVQWVVLVSAALVCLLRQSLGRLPLAGSVVAIFVLVGVVTALSSMAAMSLVPPMTGGNSASAWVARNLCVAVVATGIGLRYFYLQQTLIMREQSALKARLDALQSRIRPHFLFNTMNSIASLVSTRPHDAERVIEDLSALFRASLGEHKTLSTVEREWQLCQQYLDIEKWRLGERLQVQVSIPNTLKDLPLPHLMLQPLVENAVYHGVAALPEGGCICVDMALDEGEGMLNICLTNPVGASRNVDGHQIAISNIRQRLKALYGNEAGLQIMVEDDLFRVMLHVPVEVGQ